MDIENKISQKEYLKRYLSNDKDKKKKKQKIVSSSTALKRSQIIDDDIDLKHMRVLDDDEVELYQLDEDAPQIAGIIDERPTEVQAMEYYGNKKRWKVFGAGDGEGELMIKDNFENSDSAVKKELKSSDLIRLEDNGFRRITKLIREKSGNDSGDDNEDVNVVRKSKSSENNSSKKIKKHGLPVGKSQNESDSDLSPPRHSYKSEKSVNKKSKQRSDESDLSPPRRESGSKKKSKDVDSDLSPTRQSHKSTAKKSRKSSSDSDLSPPRRANVSPRRKSKRNSDTDLSPPRRSHGKKSRHYKDSDFSPHRHSQSSRKNNKGNYRYDSQPWRKNFSGESSEYGDSRRYNDKYSSRDRDFDKSDKYKETSKAFSYKRSRRKNESDESDGDRYEKGRQQQSSKEKELSHSGLKSSESKHNKMGKTLDGKQAGLQNARQLKKELTEFKEREDQLFSKLSSDLSGKGAAAVMRDRKTGQKRDLEKERLEALEKAEKSAVQNEKYSRWGKGVKQVEDAAERLADAVHEMSKPLARYADDDDLDKLLKAQEREGDPMLDYIRKKQTESIQLTESKPVYQGSFLPNRFGIRPGYRWDGVDRSSGYEKQWFTTQNNRKARDEEAYKWSVSDM